MNRQYDKLIIILKELIKNKEKIWKYLKLSFQAKKQGFFESAAKKLQNIIFQKVIIKNNSQS